ncbi:hypothetical protein EUGRSUZ_F03533 [Eucalyptus grandis]|uniref:Uncharacterized protein n=2 Tax=Eucalyptus grandis TaxID=71139 RepID=A0ACC3KLS0_EUCGR|nr:hypothetical protein EUGRSUZ_F03533 [Eucalyptus grandis]
MYMDAHIPQTCNRFCCFSAKLGIFSHLKPSKPNCLSATEAAEMIQRVDETCGCLAFFPFSFFFFGRFSVAFFAFGLLFLLLASGNAS